MGLAVLSLTLFQRSRSGGPGVRFPRPNRGHMYTVLAWVIIAVLAYAALSRR
ncbi:MAG TPA: hypothetical protein VLW53_17405 [Candidatus Eisenbacteria bacterium]|nr:hypothetical protein [Candidatus Eisenbacteria bacterium]